jgi:hypothetical protein
MEYDAIISRSDGRLQAARIVKSLALKMVCARQNGSIRTPD